MNTGDIENDPEFKAWAARVSEELVPALAGSDFMVSVVPKGEPDVKFAVELGLSVMMDKPLILAVSPGTHVPAKLARVADEIVSVDWQGPPEKAMDAVQEAVERLARRGMKEEES